MQARVSLPGRPLTSRTLALVLGLAANGALAALATIGALGLGSCLTGVPVGGGPW